MRIAVASNGLEVSPYLETCTNYNFFTLANGELIGYRNLPILDQNNHSAIEILEEVGIDTLIVGCLKKGNRKILEQSGITVLCGAKGDAKQTVEDYLADTFIACDGSYSQPQDKNRITDTTQTASSFGQ